MPELEHAFSPALLIPDFLVGEVQSKLAYVDENIRQAQVAPAGDRITLYLQRPADQPPAKPVGSTGVLGGLSERLRHQRGEKVLVLRRVALRQADSVTPPP